MSDVQFKVGKHVEFTNEEARDLQALASDMRHASKYKIQGWLLVYLRAHKRSHVILRTIIERSHAS